MAKFTETNQKEYLMVLYMRGLYVRDNDRAPFLPSFPSMWV